MGRGVVRLGDDLAPGERAVRLSLLGPQAGDAYEQHVRGLPLGDRRRLAERIVAQAAVEA